MKLFVELPVLRQFAIFGFSMVSRFGRVHVIVPWLYLAMSIMLLNRISTNGMLTCGMQTHADGDALQDPLLGYGDPYGVQDPPDVHASDRAAPPAESIASKTASALPPPLPPSFNI